MDGLQEDLNRIHKKPYIEKPDSTDEMVHDQNALREMADKCWDIYKARNDSVITDLFAGMYKSTVVCPVCDKVSIIFDPFNNLTLQLPVENVWSKIVFVFPMHARPHRVSVDIDRNATFWQVKEYVGRKSGIDPKRLVTSEIYKHRFFKMFNDKVTIGEERIADGDVIALYEVDEVPTNYPVPKKTGQKIRSMLHYQQSDDEEEPPEGDSPLADKMLVPVFNRVPKDGVRYPARNLFGIPTYIVLSREEARDEDEILRKVLAKIDTMTTLKLLQSEDDSEPGVDETDTVEINSEDVNSSINSKIKADSIQSEDSIVDISMREPNEGILPRVSYPPSPKYSSPSKTLQAGEPIPDGLRRLFNINVLHTNEMIPTGWNSLQDENKKYPSLATRVADRESRRRRVQGGLDANLKSRRRNSGSASSSEDEIDAPPPVAGGSTFNPVNYTEQSEEEDTIDPSQESLGKGPGKSGFETRLTIQSLIADAGTDSQDGSFDDENDDTIGGKSDDGPPLVGLGEALVLDWDKQTHDSLFADGAYSDDPEFRGRATWEECPLAPDAELERKRTFRLNRRRNGVSLDDCLDEFGKEEILSENDAWYCPRCKEHRRASKKFELWKAPDILVVHLKRFSAQGRLRDKLDIFVEFPIEGLDLSSRVAVQDEGRELIYDLFAVDNHYGGLGGGHYTAFAKNFFDDHWYEYNGKSDYDL